MRHQVTFVLIGCIVLAVGCERRVSSDAPPAEGPAGRDSAPPATTQPASAPTQPATPGRAVVKPDPARGPVIIDGSAPGSPGTRGDCISRAQRRAGFLPDRRLVAADVLVRSLESDRYQHARRIRRGRKSRLAGTLEPAGDRPRP